MGPTASCTWVHRQNASGFSCIYSNIHVLLQQEHRAYRDATSRHISIFAAAGDQGAAQSTCDGSSYIRKASGHGSDGQEL